MKYFKIVKNEELVGVITSNNFFIENANSLVASNDALGQYVEYNGKLYRDYWMQPTINERNFNEASISEISLQDYFAFIQAQRKNETIIIEDEIEEIQEPVIIEEEPKEINQMLEYIRSSKLNEMSRACRTTIEKGFDLELRGETKHFSLDTQDQLNLMSLGQMAQTQSLIPYHADGEACEFYTSSEINEIITAATTFKNYQLVYYNALRSYIETLETMEEIAAITYGTPIPDEYKTDVLKVLEY